MIAQTEKIIGIAQKTKVAQALAGLANKPNIADMIWKVPPPMQATSFKADLIKNEVARLAVEHLGVDPDMIADSGMMEEWDDILTVYTNAWDYWGKDNIIPIVVDGNRQFYEVNPDLFAVLKGLDSYTLPKFLNIILGTPTRLMRLGATGLNVSFGLIRNFIRDTLGFSVLAKHAKYGPLSTAKGVLDDIMNTAESQLFKAMGGQMAGQIMHDRK